jgi:hypothetical protein
MAPSGRVGEGARPFEGKRLKLQLLDAPTYDSGVALLRDDPI